MRDVAFFEKLFPEAGSWSDLRKANRLNDGVKAESIDKSSLGEFIPTTSCFTVIQVEQFNKMFKLLDQDKQARATLAGIIQYTQLKSDVAGF